MGVYLPNVDMPKDDKVVTIQICPDGSIWQQYRGTVPNAKAVPVPPHGRLIDADAVVAEIDSYIDSMAYSYSYLLREEQSQREHGMVFARNIVCDAPTIITAEEG